VVLEPEDNATADNDADEQRQDKGKTRPEGDVLEQACATHVVVLLQIMEKMI